MSGFEDAYAAWRHLPMPPGGPWDDIDDLHADMAFFDSMVANEVVPWGDDGRLGPPSVVPNWDASISSRLKELELTAMQIQEVATGEKRKAVDDLLSYLHRLMPVWEAFRAEVRSP